MHKKSGWLGYVVVLALGLGVGLAGGAIIWGEKNLFNNVALEKSNVNRPNIMDLKKKTQEELMGDLSDIMMPKDEYNKIIQAIFQAGLGLLSAQSEPAKVTVSPGVETQLKGRVENRYSRKYFTDMHAKSMADLKKEDLEAILAFYYTEAGEKFLRLSPSIVENTMKSAQLDLSAWLPQEVEKMIAEMKNGGKPSNDQEKNKP